MPTPTEFSPAGPPGVHAAPSGKSKPLWTWLAILLGVLFLLGAGYLGWRFWGADDPDKNILTAVVTKGDLEDVITATGSLQPKQFVDVGTQVSGQLKRVLVEVGSLVQAKQLLAEIDPSVYLSKVDADRAQLRNQGAQLTDKQAQLAKAELQLTRQKNMMREDATTAEALQEAEATARSARAQVESVKAQMQQTESTLRGDEANLSYTKIYAPISGTVVSQAAKQGQTLNANQQAPIVLRIADLSVMTVQAQVSEADVPKLKIGMDVYFTTLGASRRRHYGTLRQIPPTPNVLNNVVLYDALFDVPNPDQRLMTQMTAQVFFVLASATDAVQVPLTALRPLPGGADAKRADNAGADDRRGGQGRAGGRERPPGAERRAPDGRSDRGEGRGARGGDPRSQLRDGFALVSVVNKDESISERKVKVGVMTRVAAEILEGLTPGEVVVIGTRPDPKPEAAKTGSAIQAGQNQGGRR